MTMQDEIGACYGGELKISHMGDDDPEIGLFGIKLKGISRAFKKGLRSMHKLTKSPLVKGLATGAAFVFPPVGVPVAAGVAVAGRINLNVHSKNKRKAAAARRVIVRTAQLAKRGDVSARRGLKLLARAGRRRKKLIGKRRRVRKAATLTRRAYSAAPRSVHVHVDSWKRPPRWLVPWLKRCCRKYPVWWKKPPPWLRGWLLQAKRTGWPTRPPKLKDVKRMRVFAPVRFSVTPRGRVLSARV